MKIRGKTLYLLAALALTATHLCAQHREHGNSVVILDQGLPYLDVLLKGIKPGTYVEYLNESMPSLYRIHNIIRKHAPISSLHIITNGKPGALMIEMDEINNSLIEKNEALLETWKQYFVHHGDIILYGSDVGKGQAGLHFVATLAVLTGLDVAASKDVTGATLKHGDWLMELRSGHIESTLVLSKQIRAEYPSVLNATLNKGLFSSILRLN